MLSLLIQLQVHHTHILHQLLVLKQFFSCSYRRSRSDTQSDTFVDLFGGIFHRSSVKVFLTPTQQTSWGYSDLILAFLLRSYSPFIFRVKIRVYEVIKDHRVFWLEVQCKMLRLNLLKTRRLWGSTSQGVGSQGSLKSVSWRWMPPVKPPHYRMRCFRIFLNITDDTAGLKISTQPQQPSEAQRISRFISRGHVENMQ